MRLRAGSILFGERADKLAFVPAAIALVLVLGSESLAFQLAALTVGFASTTLGGFVAGRHAGERPVAHGVAVGICTFALSFTRFLVNTALLPEGGSAAHPLWWELVAWSGAVAAGALGGRLAVAPRESVAAP